MLRELQHRFAAALFADDHEMLGAELRGNGGEARARLDIYRLQLHAVFVRTLAREFPVIERLVGGEYFRHLGREFQTAHPSRAGDLQHIGAPFAAFLKQRFAGGAYDYLSDVAALEWAVQECMIAPEAVAFAPHALRSVAPDDYAQLHFEFHPACRLVSSRYPTLPIWRANQSASAATPIIDLASGATRALVQRSAEGVAFHLLSAPEHALLAKIAQDFCLGAALEAAQQCEAAFDLGPALRRLLALHALTAFRLRRKSCAGIA